MLNPCGDALSPEAHIAYTRGPCLNRKQEFESAKPSGISGLSEACGLDSDKEVSPHKRSHLASKRNSYIQQEFALQPNVFRAPLDFCCWAPHSGRFSPSLSSKSSAQLSHHSSPSTKG
ncbi:unnamed protein product [Lota lota]